MSQSPQLSQNLNQAIMAIIWKRFKNDMKDPVDRDDHYRPDRQVVPSGWSKNFQAILWKPFQTIETIQIDPHCPEFNLEFTAHEEQEGCQWAQHLVRGTADKKLGDRFFELIRDVKRNDLINCDPFQFSGTFFSNNAHWVV